MKNKKLKLDVMETEQLQFDLRSDKEKKIFERGVLVIHACFFGGLLAYFIL